MSQGVGQQLTAWQKEELIIHQISTGQGNATFAVLPDGTTLLIDAGAISSVDWRTNAPRNLPTKPNASRRAGQWIARYISRYMPIREKPSLDYAVLTHFHDDHMGSPVLAPLNQSGDYALTGITEVAEYITISRIIDRGWPDYRYPRPMSGDSMMMNYQRFLTKQIEQNNLKVDRFRAGLIDQIRLVKQPRAYKANFHIRNIAANGEIWTGRKQSSRAIFPPLGSLQPAQYPTENMCSAVMHIQYGRFDYFTGGDIPGVLRFGSPAWHDVETPVANVAGQIDVQLMDHHGYEDAQNGTLLKKLRPQVLVIPVWHESHANDEVLERVFSDSSETGERDVFATQLLKKTPSAIAAKMKSTAGHVVVRVKPGGGSYRVFVLEDTDEQNRIKAVYGPYQSK
ncbi:hypothetical protein J2I48_05780 [Fibrella sp. HMF5036]|uniref:MBL fold metallo-hydrolase n=2 Tax=Fibrella aquatilis TaxID=2817059 RepID=A0A939G3F7_9BACT|nr:hypothetical protein [Fibrella aquatilis]